MGAPGFGAGTSENLASQGFTRWLSFTSWPGGSASWPSFHEAARGAVGVATRVHEAAIAALLALRTTACYGC